MLSFQVSYRSTLGYQVVGGLRSPRFHAVSFRREKLEAPVDRQPPHASGIDRTISWIAHVVTLTSFSIITGYACRLLLMTQFSIGVLIGVAFYGTLLGVLSIADDEG